MAINISGSFVDDTTPMTGNMDFVPHIGIHGPPGPQGAPGGYYVPAIEQTGENELEVSFSPSLPDMPYVAPVKVTVTPDPDSGGNANQGTVLTSTEKNALLTILDAVIIEANKQPVVAEALALLRQLWSGGEVFVSQSGSTLVFENVTAVTSITQNGTVLALA